MLVLGFTLSCRCFCCFVCVSAIEERQIGLRSASDEHQNTENVPWIASGGPLNDSMGADRHYMSFVDGFGLQKVETGTQIGMPTVHRFIFLRLTYNGPQMILWQSSDGGQMDFKFKCSLDGFQVQKCCQQSCLEYKGYANGPHHCGAKTNEDESFVDVLRLYKAIVDENSTLKTLLTGANKLLANRLADGCVE